MNNTNCKDKKENNFSYNSSHMLKESITTNNSENYNTNKTNFIINNTNINPNNSNNIEENNINNTDNSNTNINKQKSNNYVYKSTINSIKNNNIHTKYQVNENMKIKEETDHSLSNSNFNKVSTKKKDSSKLTPTIIINDIDATDSSKTDNSFEHDDKKFTNKEDNKNSAYININTNTNPYNTNNNLSTKTKTQANKISSNNNNNNSNNYKNKPLLKKNSICLDKKYTNNSVFNLSEIKNSTPSNKNLLSNTNLENVNINYDIKAKKNNSNKIITDLDIQSNNKLEIIDYESKLIAEKSLLINASGLVKGSLRNSKDGCTYFGLGKKNSSGDIACDYVLNLNYTSNINNKKGSLFSSTNCTLFKVFFEKENKGYYLSPTYNSCNEDLFIIFVKLEKPFVSHIYKYITY